MNEKKELRMISNFSCFIADITALRLGLSSVESWCSEKNHTNQLNDNEN